MLHKRERFRHKCYSYITHCMSACTRFAAQFSSMLHLLNATSPHGLSQRFHFLKCCTRERFRRKCYSCITHCMSACKRFAAQFSSMLHLLNATSPHGLTGRMKVMLVEHHKMWNPFPLESFTGQLLFFRSVGFLPPKLLKSY